MALETSRQLNRISGSKIRELDDLFSSIDDCIRMTLGEPDFNMPEQVKRAAIQAIEENDSHYSHSMGDIGVRKAVAHFLKEQHQLSFDPETEIVMTIGATGAIYSSLLGVLNPGEKVIIPTPAFPLYKQATLVAYGEPIEVDTSKTGFLLTPEQLHQTMREQKNVKALVLNYPGNPTGVTYTKEQLEDLAEAISQYDIFVISDEIYSELTYDTEHISLARLLPEQTILINGASKSFAMTGWRVGYAAAKAKWMPAVFKAHQTAVTTGVSVSFKAVEEAYLHGSADVERMRVEYERRKDICVEALTEAGFHLAEPKGAFYIFAEIPNSFGRDDEEFCRRLAKEARVGTIPGSFFGPGGEGHLRISFALDTEKISEAMKRIKEFAAREKSETQPPEGLL